MRVPFVLIAAAIVVGCKPEPSPPPMPATTAKAPPDAQAFDFEPIPARLGLPTQVAALRLGAGPVGTYVDLELPDAVPLRAVGLNLCQTGFVIQGFLERDGELAVTPPLHIPYATLPTGPAEVRQPNIAGQALVLDLDQASMTRLSGSVRIVADGADTDTMRMTFDAEPVGITTGPGLGGQGCFTTGYYELRLGADERIGPVSGVWDQKRLHYLGLRLTEQHGIGVWLLLEPAHRQPQNVIRGDLATVLQRPTRFPFRVVFETRKTTAEGMHVDETPAKTGKIMGVFRKANPQGPVRVEIEGLTFPDWDGPLAGATVDVRVEALLVTDVDGVGVPVPSEPQFDQERPRRLDPSPDAALRVSPGADQK